ncbi:MAG: cytochrome C oxidase subunit IV family protein [Anaerolineae bacterium]|nr:cytochrome C oxidase subunit IV family protein [Anaerolineae bacterium]
MTKHVDPTKEALQPHRYPGSRTYLLVFAALALLTLIEVAVSYIHGDLKVPLLILLSVAKALLVILFFMHLRYDSRWYAFIFFAPLVLVIPLIWVSLIR